MPSFKFIACSDIHIRNSIPISRKDLFYSSLRRKLIWLFKLALYHNAYIVCGGDVFNSVSVPHSVIEDIIRLALKYNVKLLTVYGQHDLRYHVYRSYKNTPLAILLSSLGCTHLDEAPFVNDIVAIQGASWGREVPHPIPGKINILATHRMVTENGPLWEAQNDYITGGTFLDTAQYDIIVSGDNHKSFICAKDNRYVINSGSIARTTILQIDYTPRVVLCSIDGKNINCEWIEVPVRDPLIVFRHNIIDEYNKKNDVTKEQLQLFAEQLNTYKIDKPDFMYNLHKIKGTIVDKGIITALETIADKVGQTAKV